MTEVGDHEKMKGACKSYLLLIVRCDKLLSRITDLLHNDGPMLAGVLAKKLIAKYALSPEAARKEISRASAPVRRLRNISFDNNQKFLYLDDQFQKSLYFEKALSLITIFFER